MLIGAFLYAFGMLIGALLNICDLIKDNSKSISLVLVLAIVLLIVFK